ncbi:MAG TPA: hypothetical protein VGN72_05495 [Tepidisphaeraceae bacterium]|nr:hypothetical protein [Tepidisphaeraceae bacterium]
MKRTLNFVVMAVMAMYLVLRVADLVVHGFKWSSVIWVHVYLIGITIALVWELHGRHSAVPIYGEPVKPQLPAPAAKPLLSLVALLERPTPLDAEDLRKRLSRALGQTLDSSPKNPNHLVLAPDQTYELQHGDHRMAIVNLPTPYVKDRENEAAAAPVKELAIAILNHQAWRAVDWVESPAELSREQVYATLGPVLVELMTDVKVLALFCPETGQMVPWRSGLPDLLRGADPLQALLLTNTTAV